VASLLRVRPLALEALARVSCVRLDAQMRPDRSQRAKDPSIVKTTPTIAHRRRGFIFLTGIITGGSGVMHSSRVISQSEAKL